MAGRADIARDLSLQSLVDDDCRLAVEACSIGLVMTDSAGRIALANPEIERLFGYPPRELTGETIEILLAPRTCDTGRRSHAIRRPATPEKSATWSDAAATAASFPSRSASTRSATANARA